MSLKKQVFSCVLTKDDTTKGAESEQVEIDARRSSNDLILSVVRTNKSPEKELEIDEGSEVCRKGKQIILGDYGLTLNFKTEEMAKDFRRFTDFR
jgi:hypothetical protein